MTQTGILTGETTFALMDALRDKIKEDDPHVLKAKEVLIRNMNNNNINKELAFDFDCQLFSIEEVLNNERRIFI